MLGFSCDDRGGKLWLEYRIATAAPHTAPHSAQQRGAAMVLMDDPVTLGGIVAAVAVVLATLFFLSRKPAEPEPEPEPEPAKSRTAQAPALKKQPAKKQPQQKKGGGGKGPKHPLQHYSAKPHSGSVSTVAFSRNGRTVACTGADRKVTVMQGFENGSAGVKSKGVQVISQTSSGVDFADGVCCGAIGARNNYLLVATETNALRGYYLPDVMGDVGAKGSSQTVNFAKAHDENRTIHNVALAPKGNYMLSCTNETEIKLFAFPPQGGDAVETINTNQTKNHQLKMSPDGAFFACATHASEVKVWRVDTGPARTPGSNDGAPTGCTKAGVLTGHKRGVWSVDWSADSSKAVTASKDGTWRLYDMKEGIAFCKCVCEGNSALGEITVIALSKDGSVIAAVVGTTIQFIKSADNTVLDTIPQAHGLTINCVTFSPDGSLLASVSDDCFVKMWKVPEV
jgi:WD40 repeat protein